MATNVRTILVKAPCGYAREEYTAAGTVYPGMLGALNTSGNLKAHDVAGGAAERMIVVEDDNQGKTVDDAYSATNKVQVNLLKPGDQAHLLLANGESVVIGDRVVSNGDGYVKKMDFATLATGVVLSNNAITWTSKLRGALGNLITVELDDPSANSQSLAVTVTGYTIHVDLATGSGGAITSTAAEVIAAIAASATANALVSAANTGASTGAAAVAAVGPSYLTGADSNDAAVAVALEALNNTTGAAAFLLARVA